MKLIIPELSLVVLAGPSGCGKSAFAARHFHQGEIVSAEAAIRQLLAAGELAVVDGANVRASDRRPLVALAREYHVIPVAIVFQIDQQTRATRAVRAQLTDLRNSLRGIDREGFQHVYILSSAEEVDDAVVERQPLGSNRKNEHGPFDIIGDVHGCLDELLELLEKMGYQVFEDNVALPAGRTAVFVGDLVDRGPKIAGVLHLVMSMVKSGAAFCVPGNHDGRLLRKLKGRDIELTHGLAETMEQLESETAEFREKVAGFFDSLPSHLVLDEGRLVVAHAGLTEQLQGRESAEVRKFALYGDTTGETDGLGLPVRLNWAADYHGKAVVVYGHTPVAEPRWENGAIDIDTGCVYGGRLTALRYPARELISVPARRNYKEDRRRV